MLQYQFRPISMWPGPKTPSRKRAAFRAGFNDTLKLLERELHHLQGNAVVIEAEVDEKQVRRDGMLYADARPRGPGVILSFSSRYGPLRYPCDRYSDWRDNVRAIALALEALRAVDRYGVTRRAEQYTGWKALPPATSSGDGEMGPLDAAEWLIAKYSEVMGCAGRICHRESLCEDADLRGRLYRELAKKMHPDIQGGSHEAFKALTRAMRAFEQGG